MHKKLRLDKRAGSDNWYARLTLPNGKRLVKTTKTEDLETAREVALRLYYEVDACIQNKLSATTRKFADVAAVTRLDAWRTAQTGKVPAQSTINNHNSALNRVLDEAELNGWIVKSLRPKLLNKGVKTQSRGSFTVEEYRTIYSALRSFHKQTSIAKSAVIPTALIIDLYPISFSD